VSVEIVGREDEVAALHAFFDRAGGGPGDVVLEGDAGIGKPTLWLAGVEVARERSLRVRSVAEAGSPASAAPFGVGRRGPTLIHMLPPIVNSDPGDETGAE